MSEIPESEIIRMFRESVKRGDFKDDLKISYNVSGGMPHQRIEEEFVLSGTGKAITKKQDVLRSIRIPQVSAKLDRTEVLDIFQQIEQGLDSLVTRSKARFLPDSVVGSITIEVKGEKTTLYFLADEEERVNQNKPISSQMAKAIQNFTNISQRILKKERGESNG